MELSRIARETCDTLVNYLTYQAVKIVLSQIQETNPALYVWLKQFTKDFSFQRSDEYLQALYREKPELALRMMIVRADLVDDLADSLPEMTRSSVEQANMNLRRHMLEQMTRAELVPPENSFPDSEN